MKALGEEHQIPELATPVFPLDGIDGHYLAMLASGICHADAYYRCPYEGGAAIILIKDENFPKNNEPPLKRIAGIFPQAIASIEIANHRQTLAAYLEHYGLVGEAEGDTLVVKENGEAVLTAAFDEHEAADETGREHQAGGIGHAMTRKASWRLARVLWCVKQG